MYSKVDSFALNELRLTPVEPGLNRGYYWEVKRLVPNMKKRTQAKRLFKRVYVPHRVILEIYSEINRLGKGIFGRGYSKPNHIKKAVDGTYYFSLLINTDDGCYGVQRTITEFTHSLCSESLKGGKN